MCLATCFKRNRKIVHSIHCPQFFMFADGTSLPPDWSFLSYEEKIKLKEAHMSRKRQSRRRDAHVGRHHLGCHFCFKKGSPNE
jgi:hypothetical protein